jgi:hypothetical protein
MAQKRESPLAKLVNILDTSSADAALARQRSADPRFRAAVQKDRRKALSGFGTVKQALADRAKAERARAARAKAKAKKKT